MLYDLRNNIGEATDVAAEHPEIVKRIDRYLATARSPSADWEPRWSVERKSPK